MKRLLHSTGTLIICLIAAGCSKTPVTIPFTDFPVTTNTYWKYMVFDSLRNSIDTEVVTIMGDTTLKNGMRAKIIRSYFIFNEDTTITYLTEASGHLRFYAGIAGTDYNKSYDFPLKPGNYWIGENQLDTNKVVSQAPVSVIAGSFPCYLIQRNYLVTNQVTIENEQYSVGIGMITRDYYERNIGFMIKKHYELVSYYIAQ